MGKMKKETTRMTPKRMLFRAAVRSAEWLYLRRKPKFACHMQQPPAEGGFDLYTVAFNNPRLLPLQERQLKKHFGVPYTHIILDNSTDGTASGKIRDYCQQHGIPYVRLPQNPLNRFGSSYSHAAVMNWMCRNVISKRNPACWGVLDHDLFPVATVGADILAVLDRQGFYGPQRKRNGMWYLSAIMFFFRNDFLKGKHADFMPVTYGGTYLDSGGGNWPGLFSQVDDSRCAFCSEQIENFRGGGGGNRHSDQVEIFDSRWLHTINGSYWKKVDSKEELLDGLISEYERKLSVGTSNHQ